MGVQEGPKIKQKPN